MSDENLPGEDDEGGPGAGRRDLGGDAVILATREVRRRRLFGLGTRELIEVTAPPTAARESPARSAPRPPGRRRGRAPTARRARRLAAASQAQFGEQLSRLHAMVETLSRQGRIDHLLPDLPGELVPTMPSSLEAEVPEVLARRLVRHVADRLEPDQVGIAPRRSARRSATRSRRASRSPRRSRRSPGRGGSWPWSGRPASARRRPSPSSRPTSSWRTASAPGLVTVDTYRIAAVEQLRTYAEIIDLPLAVANAPGEMPRAIDELGDVDIVLIDTAGRSPRDEVKIRELADFLAAGPARRGPPGPQRRGRRAEPPRRGRAVRPGPGRPPDPDQARRGRRPGRRPRRARPGRPARELPDHRPGRPRRHRAGRGRIGWLAWSSGWRRSVEDTLPGSAERRSRRRVAVPEIPSVRGHDATDKKGA